jgi:hypothetical protein
VNGERPAGIVRAGAWGLFGGVLLAFVVVLAAWPASSTGSVGGLGGAPLLPIIFGGPGPINASARLAGCSPTAQGTSNCVLVPFDQVLAGLTTADLNLTMTLEGGATALGPITLV